MGAESGSYEDFYRAAAPRLVTFLMAQGLPSNDAADCAQEALIAALPPVWPTIENPYAWCRVVAHRKMCRLLRDRRRESPEEDLDRRGSGTLLVGDLPGIEALEGKFELLYWLSRLTSPMQRTVLAWTYDGATPSEIASALGMNPATVRSTLRHGRQMLRRMGEKAGDRGEG